MKPTEHDIKVSGDIDFALRQGEFQYVPLTETSRGTGYTKWYARLLTTLTLMLDGEEILYSQTDYTPDAPTARLLIVTGHTVVVIDVTGLNEERPKVSTRVVGRRSLRTLEVAASTPVDQEGSAAYSWPGQVEIVATYADLDDPLVYTSTGYKRGDSNERGPILALLKELQLDLNR